MLLPPHIPDNLMASIHPRRGHAYCAQRDRTVIEYGIPSRTWPRAAIPMSDATGWSSARSLKLFHRIAASTVVPTSSPEA